MNRTLFALCVSVTVLSSAIPVRAQDNAAGSTPLTLAKAIESAIQSQPTLASATASKDAAYQRVKQSQAANLPRVTPSYQYQAQYNFGTINRFLGNGVVTQLQAGSTTTTRQEEISLSYRILDTGSRALTIRQARQNMEASELSQENTKQTVIANVADAYFTALRNDALVKVSEAQVARAEKTRDQVRAQVKAGVTREIDTFQAEADLLNAQVNLLQARNNADVAHTQLRNAIGIGGQGRFQLADVPKPDTNALFTAQVDGVKPDTEPSKAISGLVTSALSDRPDILQANKNVAASATSVKLAKLSTTASVTADLSGGYSFDAAKNPFRTIGNNRAINFAVSYPLIDGGQSRAGLHLSEAQQRTSEAQLTQQKQQVLLEVEQAYRNLALARVQLPAAESAQQAAEKNFTAASRAFELGTGTVVEVITAQTALVQAQTNYVQAFYSFYSADARLARVVGQAERIAKQ